jgi:hypothetical protein
MKDGAVKPEGSGAGEDEKIAVGNFAACDAARAFQVNPFVDGKIEPVAETQPEERQRDGKY